MVKVDQSKQEENKMLVAMTLIGGICAFFIVSAYLLTLPRIEKLKLQARQAAIYRVLPEAAEIQSFTKNKEGIYTISEDLKNEESIVAGYDESGKLVGVAAIANAKGYADNIKVLYGYSMENQSIIGIYVLESKETPGLGDRIEKDSAFQANFNSLNVYLDSITLLPLHPISVVKKGTKKNNWEIDAITGATISSRAIGDALLHESKVRIPIIFSQSHNFKKP